MATLFEPSLSTSTMRPPLSSSSAPSMADSLPSINFGFDELRERMARFTHRFDDFIAEGRKRVLEERNQFRMNVAELEEDHRLKSHSLSILHQKTQAHTHLLTSQAAETAEIQTTIASLTAHQTNLTSHRAHLLSRIAAVQASINQRLAAQQAHSLYLSSQEQQNTPELDFWTSYLGLRIEGAGMVDRLKFVFTHIDERNWEREGWFELNTERRDYSVDCARPKLEGEKVERCVERLNETRDLAGFLKGMRELFVEAVK